jgi:hypothetical protein
MDLFATPKDLSAVAQDLGIRALVNTHATFGDRATSINISDLERKLKSALALLASNGSSKPFFRALAAEAQPLEEVSSKAWNDAQERTYIDLYAIYQLLQESEASDTYAGAITREKFFQTKSAILKVINEIRLYQFLKANPEYQDAKFINFYGSINDTEKRPQAFVDPDARLLELPVRQTDIHSSQNFDLRSTAVSITTVGGPGGGLHAEFKPERMLDSNPDSFWADIVMSDGPIRQEYHPSGDAGLGTKIEIDGPIVHVVLTLSHVAIANNLKILPFGEFPVRVIDVSYKESTGQGTWVMIPEFRVDAPTLDWIEINFEPKTVAQVRITLQQSSYKMVTYHLPESAVRNSLLWQSIRDTRLNEDVYQLTLSNKSQADLEIEPSAIAGLAADEDFKRALDSQDLKSDRNAEYALNLTLVDGATKAVTKYDPSLRDRLLEPVTGHKDTKLNTLVHLKKYEYIYGLRSVELRYNLYQPVAHYSSPKFVSGATILDVSLETEERHSMFTDGLGSFQKTSTEWEIEVGGAHRYPVAPENWRVVADSANEAMKSLSNPDLTNLQPLGSQNYVARPAGATTFIVVPDEYLQFSRTSMTAQTRLPIGDLTTILRRNGSRVRIDKYTVTRAVVDDPYQTTSLEPSDRARRSIPSVLQGRGLITITDPDEFDPNAVYTLQYVARDDADLIQIDSHLNSTPLEDPEIFDGTNRNNAIVLSRFPYIDYNIINSAPPEEVSGAFTNTGTSELARYKWVKDDVREARWRFQPTRPNYKNGTVDMTNGSPNVTGTGTLWLANIDTTEPNVIRAKGSNSIYIVQAVAANGQITLNETYKGTTLDDAEYVVGQYFESDGVYYAFDNMVYEPIRVYINNVKAANLTNYATFEHEAFTQVAKSGRQYQYIQAGNILYFNSPISGAKVEVYYSWLTEYVRVNATLRCNIPVATVLTPQVNSALIKLRTSKL